MYSHPDPRTLREIEREAHRLQAQMLAEMVSNLFRKVSGAFRFGATSDAH